MGAAGSFTHVGRLHVPKTPVPRTSFVSLRKQECDVHTPRSQARRLFAAAASYIRPRPWATQTPKMASSKTIQATPINFR